MKIRYLILSVSILTGCASNATISQRDISTWNYGDTDVNVITQKLGDKVYRRSQYRSNESNYLFIQYDRSKVEGLLSFLFKEGKLEAIAKDDGYGSQGLSECMVFPLYESDDPDKCLNDFTENLVKARLPLSFDSNLGNIGQNNSESVGYGVELLTYSVMTGGAPIILGAVMIPFATIGEHQDSKTDAPMGVVELGANLTEYQHLLNVLPEEAISSSGKFKSILVPGGFVFNEPQFFIGAFDGEVIWLDEKPAWVCSSVLSIKGCIVGKNRR